MLAGRWVELKKKDNNLQGPDRKEGGGVNSLIFFNLGTVLQINFKTLVSTGVPKN